MWNPNISLNSSYNAPWYHKRKIEPDPSDYEISPPKMLITEEKMVSQLRGIHLSQDYTTHGNPGPSNAEVDMEDPSNILGQKSSSSLPTLVMCDEIRELHRSVDSPFPKQLLDSFRKPTNALVLWRPPVGDLGKYLMNLRDSSKEENKEGQRSTGDVDMEDNNNNESDNQNMNGVFARTI